MECASAPTFYLSSNSAREPPHGFIRGVVLTSTPHLKGKCHSVSFNLQQGTEKKVALHTCMCNVFTVYVGAKQLILP